MRLALPTAWRVHLMALGLLILTLLPFFTYQVLGACSWWVYYRQYEISLKTDYDLVLHQGELDDRDFSIRFLQEDKLFREIAALIPPNDQEVELIGSYSGDYSLEDSTLLSLNLRWIWLACLLPYLALVARKWSCSRAVRRAGKES